MLRIQPIRDLMVQENGERRFIAAASGMVQVGELLYVVADDELALGVFTATGSAPGRLVPFLPGRLPTDPAERKRQKPDLEALALLPPRACPPGGALLALGSGSKLWRRAGWMWPLDDRGALAGEPVRLDLGPLYQRLAAEVPDLNIEGATVTGERLLLLQRGNGRGAVNAVIALELEVALRDLHASVLSPDAVTGLRRYELGEMDGVRLCFSDAASLPDGRIVFTAVAEGGEDTYLDGVCAGAGIGLLDSGGELTHLETLQPAAKVEGVHARSDGAALELLMVADADDRDSPSALVRAQWHPDRS